MQILEDIDNKIRDIAVDLLKESIRCGAPLQAEMALEAATIICRKKMENRLTPIQNDLSIYNNLRKEPSQEEKDIYERNRNNWVSGNKFGNNVVFVDQDYRLSVDVINGD
jgi:hypothetical protein